MIKIHPHARGFSLSTEDPVLLNTLLRQLERRGSEGILVFRHCLIVPSRLAADVLEIVGHNADWDERVLHQARHQVEHSRMQIRARLEVAEALEKPRHALKGYHRLNRLDEHQIAAVAAITTPSLRGLALFDEQGTGKTIIALAAFDRLKQLDAIKRLLVLAPKSVLAAWQSDCEVFFQQDYVVAIISGPSRRKKLLESYYDILLVSYDTSVKDEGLLRMIVAAEPNTYMLVMDESYFVKNPKTERSRVASIIRPFCERALVLCGAPAPNSSADIVNQIDLADGGVAFGDCSVSKDPDQTRRSIEHGMNRSIFLRRRKEDVFPDLPGKKFERIMVDLSPIQKRLYDEARDHLALSLRSIDDREFTRKLSSFLAKRAALLQICSNPYSIDPLYSEEPAKLICLDKLLKKLVESDNKKVVLWSFFRKSLEAIAERYKRYGLVRVDGSISRIEDRLIAIDRFQNDHNIRVFLGNAAAAGAGITLTASHHAIYESFSNQAAHYIQSVDRIHRRGQREAVVNYVILSKDTIETREFNTIIKKERAGRDLLGDPYSELLTRERFLADLEL